MRLTIPIEVNPFRMAPVARQMEDFLGQGNCSGEVLFEIHLVVEELLTNAVHHGGACEIELGLILTAECVFVEVVDSGPAFDPLSHEVQGLDADFSDRQVGGMGIHLVKEIMDDVSYTHKDGKNRVQAFKKLATG